MATSDQPRVQQPKLPEAQGKPRKKGRGGLPLGLIIGVIAVIAVAVIAASSILASLGQAPVEALSGQTEVTINTYPSLMTFNGTAYMAYFGGYTSQQGATIYITKLPTFVNPEYMISLLPQKPVRVAIGSPYANLQLALVSASTSSVRIEVTPIGYLSLGPNTTAVSVINTSLYGAMQLHAANVTITTTVGATSSTAAATTTTGSSVTTTVSYNTTAMGILEGDPYYPVMANYSTMFANSVNCTGFIYNTTYRRLERTNPSGQSTYANASQIIPYKMNYSITNYGSGISVVTYSTFSHSSSTTGAALIVNISRSSGAVNSNRIRGGFFYGNLSIVRLNLVSGYSATNACDAYFS